MNRKRRQYSTLEEFIKTKPAFRTPSIAFQVIGFGAWLGSPAAERPPAPHLEADVADWIDGVMAGHSGIMGGGR